MQTKHFPMATICIIVINGIILPRMLSGEQTHIIRNYGFIPNQIFNPIMQKINDQQNPLNSLLQHSEPQSSIIVIFST